MTRRRGLPTTMSGLAGLAIAFLLVPLVALAWMTPWSRIGDLATDPVLRSALRLSLVASVLALAASTVLGVPLAWVLARLEFPGKNLLRNLATLPMVLPPLVSGVALLLAFGRRGLVGEPLARVAGVTIPFSLAAVVMAASFVSMPFLVTSLEAALRLGDGRLEEAASTLGAGRWRTFWRVTLPSVSPSLAAGLALTWARALGEFGATITFAGNLPGRTQTMPLAVFLQLESNPPAAYLLSVVMLTIAVLVLLFARREAPWV